MVSDMVLLAYRSKCTYYEIYILNAFQNDKKFGQKIPGVHLNIHPPKFYGERTFLVACIKKRKNCHINNNFVAPKFDFFTEATKMSSSRETW
jgi:hypothetical protein